jgi:hypothetical protein
MDFASEVGQGYGPAWRGIIFRPEYKDLDDVIAKSKKVFPRVFPGATWIDSPQKYLWRFPDGEELRLRVAKKPDDYWSYHGQEYPFVGWDELTNWYDLKLYLDMMSVCRSSTKGMPRKYRATANPWGRGHNAVKARFIDPAPRGHLITEEYRDPSTGGTLKRSRVAIHGTVWENKILLEADPDYLVNLLAIKEKNKRRAWLYGDWDITAGGALDDLWNRERHVVRPFKIPRSWRLDRSFDWGSSHPFSVGWWAESDGTTATLADGRTWTYPRGTLFRIAEWYGWNGQENEGMEPKLEDVAIGKGIAEREKKISAALCDGRPFQAGPADSSIFDAEPGKQSIAQGIDKGYGHAGCFAKADKSPGSRERGLAVVRRMLAAVLPEHPEDPGLYVFDTCTEGFIRTVPVLPRDNNKPDDVDSEAEDHCLHGDTLVITDSGEKKIREMVGTTGLVLSESGLFTKYSDCKMTRRNALVVKVRFGDGREIVCTPDHLFLTESGAWVEAKDLLGLPVSAGRPLENPVVVSVADFGRADTYCLNAENTHSFSVSGGIIVHNCFDEVRYRATAAKRSAGMAKAGAS